MKVCFLSAASVIHTVRWVNAMADRGHEVHLVTMHEEKIDKIDARVVVHQLKIPAPLGYYLNFFSAKKLLNKLQPDLLHVHYASGYGTLARLIAYKPTLLSVWGTDVYVFPYQSKQKEKILHKNLANASCLSSTSEAMKLQTKRFVHNKPIDVIPFGIDVGEFAPAEKKETGTIVIGTVKKLEHVYGIDLLIQSVALLKSSLIKKGYKDTAEQLRLELVGEGPQREELQQLAEAYQIDSITEFIGVVPNEAVPSYLNNMDIFVALSRSESFGVAVLEASACEIPVVVSDVGGLPEVVDEGVTGYSMPTEDINEVVEKLMGLVIDKPKREQMGKAGRKFVIQTYDWQANVKQMEATYEKVIQMNS